jgi:hypothetical protein
MKTLFAHMYPDKHESFLAEGPAADERAAEAGAATSRRHRFSEAVISTSTRLLPLVELLETIQPHVANDSVFHLRRLKIQAEVAAVQAQLKAEKPSRKALVQAFRTMKELVVEETRDISRDELRQAAKEVVLATLKNAPALISAAHQARLLA